MITFAKIISDINHKQLKRYFINAFFLANLLICLTGCFQITEKINHNANDSGTYSLEVDFSDSWLKTKTAILLEEVDGVSILSEEEIKAKLAQFRKEASKIKGTSAISTSYDFDTYIFKINFDYNSIETLNKVLNVVDKSTQSTHFKKTATTFERSANYPLPKNLIKNDDKKEDLEKATLTAIYTFEKPVESMQNATSKCSKTKKTVFLKHSIWNVLHNPKLMNNTITFITTK